MKIKAQATNIKNFTFFNQNYNYDQEIFLLNITLEVLLEKINYNFLREQNIYFRNELTIQQLAINIIRTDILSNSGMHGWIFEKAAYNSILVNECNICDYLNEMMIKIQGTDFNWGSNEIDIIYWGIEKAKWVNDKTKNLALNLISDQDTIVINNIFYNFKKVFENLALKGNGPKEYNTIWKSDFFIKQSNGNVWHGVDVKYNKTAIRENNCKIKITVFNNSVLNSQNYEYKPVINEYIFQFPYFGDFGTKLNSVYNSVIQTFKELSTTTTGYINFNQILFHQEMAKWLSENRGEKVIEILKYLDNLLIEREYPIPERITEEYSNMLILNKLSTNSNGIVYQENNWKGNLILDINGQKFEASKNLEEKTFDNDETGLSVITNAKQSPTNGKIRTELTIIDTQTYNNSILLW